MRRVWKAVPRDRYHLYPHLALTDLNHNFDCILDSLACVSDRGWHIREREAMRMDHLRVEAFLSHERSSSMRRTFAFTANAEDVNVVANKPGQVDLRRFCWEGSQTDTATAVHHL